MPWCGCARVSIFTIVPPPWDFVRFKRGIELRRRDDPHVVKWVKREGRTRGIESVQAVIEGACLRLRDGEVLEDELRISTPLRRPPRSTREGPSREGAKELEIAGEGMEAGNLVDYVYVDAGHGNPFRRVRSAGIGRAWIWRSM